MHDFFCTDPDDMHFKQLADKVRYFKEDEEGVAAMCKVMEEMRNEAARMAVLENAERMIKKGKMSLEEIADCVPALSFEELKKT